MLVENKKEILKSKLFNIFCSFLGRIVRRYSISTFFQFNSVTSTYALECDYSEYQSAQCKLQTSKGQGFEDSARVRQEKKINFFQLQGVSTFKTRLSLNLEA